jgi:hypothetical protein
VTAHAIYDTQMKDLPNQTWTVQYRFDLMAKDKKDVIFFINRDITSLRAKSHKQAKYVT